MLTAVRPETVSERVARRARAWRKAQGLTQEQAAPLFGFSQGWVSGQLEGGGLELNHLDRVAMVMGVDPGELVTLRDVSLSDTAPDDPSARKGTAEVDPAVGPRHNLATSAGPTPRKDVAAVLQAVPLSPAHLTLYGLIGTLTIEEALRLRLQLVQLIERAQHPARPARRPKRPEKK
jgi:hypothetical protein